MTNLKLHSAEIESNDSGGYYLVIDLEKNNKRKTFHVDVDLNSDDEFEITTELSNNAFINEDIHEFFWDQDSELSDREDVARSNALDFLNHVLVEANQNFSLQK